MRYSVRPKTVIVSSVRRYFLSLIVLSFLVNLSMHRLMSSIVMFLQGSLMSLLSCGAVRAGSVPPNLYGLIRCGISGSLIWSLNVPGMICSSPTPCSTGSFCSRMGAIVWPDSAWISSSTRFMWIAFRILWQMRAVVLILRSCCMAVSGSKLRMVLGMLREWCRCWGWG